MQFNVSFLPGKQAEDCDTFLVISESSSENFNTVKCSSSVSGVVKCSCPGFKSLGVCSHAVAVAEKQGLLSKYLNFYKQSKVLNITTIKMAGKQDPNVGRKKNNRRKRFKGPTPHSDVTITCENVFGVSAKQPQRQPQQQQMLSLPPPPPSASLSIGNIQLPARTVSECVFSHGGSCSSVQSLASNPVPRPGLSVSTLPQPTSNPTDGPFSFLAELLNDNPAPFTSPECEPPALGSHGLENVDMPMDVPLQSSLDVPVKVNAWITAMPLTGGREGGTHSYGSRGL